VLESDPDGIVDFIVEQRMNMGLTLHMPNYALFTFEGKDRAWGLSARIWTRSRCQSTLGAVR
jgi:hypothetical protein